MIQISKSLRFCYVLLLLLAGCSTADHSLRDSDKSDSWIKSKHKRHAVGRELQLSNEEFIDGILKPVFLAMRDTVSYRFIKHEWPSSSELLEKYVKSTETGKPDRFPQPPRAFQLVSDSLTVRFDNLLPARFQPTEPSTQGLELSFSQVEKEVIHVLMRTDTATRYCLPPLRKEKADVLPGLAFGVVFALLFKQPINPNTSTRSEKFCISIPEDLRLEIRCDNCVSSIQVSNTIPNITITPILPKPSKR